MACKIPQCPNVETVEGFCYTHWKQTQNIPDDLMEEWEVLEDERIFEEDLEPTDAYEDYKNQEIEKLNDNL